jgi:filamentous hemagglutinin
MDLPRIRGTQIGLQNPFLVDLLKADITAGRYAFEESRGRIGGVVDRRGTYHVIEGHHRMAAALEFFRQTGDDKPVQALLKWGRWSLVDKRPIDSRPFPSRSFWGSLRNWLGF